MSRAISVSSQILCGVWLLFPTRRLRLSWTPRSKRSDGGRSDLPLPATLQTQRIRNSFRPPFRLPQQKSTAFPRSVIRRTEIYPRQSMDYREWRDCYIEMPVRPRNGTGGTVQLKRRFHPIPVLTSSKNSRFRLCGRSL